MALDSVKKISVICHAVHRQQLIRTIEASGCVHLIDLAEKEPFKKIYEPVSERSEEISQYLVTLDKLINFLETMEPSRSLKEKLSEITPFYSRNDLWKLKDDEELKHKVEQAWKNSIELTEIEKDRKELEQEIEFLSSWRGLSVPVESLGERKTFTITAGTAEGEVIYRIKSMVLEQELMDITIIEGSSASTEKLLIIYHSSIASEELRKLRETGFQPIDFGDRKGTVEELLLKTKENLEKAWKEESRLGEKAVLFSIELPVFRAFRDALGLALLIDDAKTHAQKSRKTFLFQAWIRENDLINLKTELEKLGEVETFELEPEEDEIPPSPVTENVVTQPYTMLTEMFGQPTRKDPDPAPIIAPFFALFFGICIGDAGYGLFLALGALTGWYLVSRRGGNTKLFQLLFQGGIASILVGVFLGGWFGIEFTSLPAILQKPANILNSLVPGYQSGNEIRETFGVSKQFLYLTLALGLVQLTVGVIINLVKRLKAGENWSAILDQSGWLLALFGLFPWLFNHYLLDGMLYDLSGPMDRIFIYLLLVGAILIFIMGGRSGKGFGKIGLGAYAAYGIVNLLGDVLSYSRLFALALSSAIIAQVINQISGMLVELGIPVVGIVLAVLVVIGGHLFNIFMAVLSGYIHTARLQFVEFFSKFYDGTGVPFEPLKYEPRFINIRKGVS